jgi:hypothetical protein
MAYAVPCVTVTVDDPRKLGALTRMGWAGDFLWQPPALQNPPYHYINSEYIPEQRAAAPAGYVKRGDMLLVNWEVLTGSWDDRARPATSPRTRFLHAYGGAAGAVSKVRSRADYGPNWCGWFYRYVPPAGTLTASTCDFSVKLCAASGAQWRIIIPTRNEQAKYPRLLRNAADGLPMSEVSRLDVDTTASQDAGWQEYVVWCEQTMNAWIIVLKANGALHRWYYAYPGTDAMDATVSLCADGPLEVQSQGQQLMFAVAPIRYPEIAEAYLRSYFPVSTDLAALATQVPEWQASIVAPTGTDAWVDVETSGAALAPRVTFLTTGTKRAVCGVVSVIVPPAFDAGTYTDEWSTAAGNATFGAGDAIEYTRRSSWRGNEFTIPLRDGSAALAWKGNEVAVLKAAYQTTDAAPTLAALVTGYVQGLDRDRESPVDMSVPLRVTDFFGARMPHKSMIFMPSFARMTFGKAFEIIAERLGFPDAQQDCDGTLAATVLPGPQVIGEQSLYWGAEARPEEALDTLAACVGGFVGIAADGKLFAKPVPTYSTPDYTLDSDATAAGDLVRHILYRRDMEDFANNCFVITGSEGWRRIGWARDADSEATSTAADFIGDQFLSVTVAENTFATAQTLAARSLAMRSRFSEVIEWTPVQAHTTLAPGCWVKAQVEDMQVTTDSIWFVTEERGVIVPTLRDAGGWRQTLVMVRYS